MNQHFIRTPYELFHSTVWHYIFILAFVLKDCYHQRCHDGGAGAQMCCLNWFDSSRRPLTDKENEILNVTPYVVNPVLHFWAIVWFHLMRNECVSLSSVSLQLRRSFTIWLKLLSFSPTCKIVFFFYLIVMWVQKKLQKGNAYFMEINSIFCVK